MAHKTYRDGDEIYCTVCRRRWEVGDEPPEDCTPYSTPPAPERSLPDEQVVTQEQWDSLKEWASNGFKDGERPEGI